MDFENTYQDEQRAAAYDELDLGGTYQLAFRDVPELLAKHVSGTRAVDFGCGTGRSTRVLRGLGFQTVGVDIAQEMVNVARGHDPDGDYRVIEDGDFDGLPQHGFDLVLCSFPFDNIPEHDRKVGLFDGLRGLLAPKGRILNIVSTAEIYTNEWVSFTTSDYPENRGARCGDVVLIRTTEYSDGRPVEDIFWPHEDYLRVYEDAGLRCIHRARPLASGEDGMDWKSETEIPPWSLYVLGAMER
jgi:SAM-dependent methyltransferase